MNHFQSMSQQNHFKPFFCLYFMVLVHISFAVVPAQADVSKKALQEQVLNSLKSTLNAELPYKTTTKENEKRDEKEKRNKISARAQKWSALIDKIPSDVVRDDVASWIKDSMVSQVQGLGLSSLFENDVTNENIYYNDAVKRLSSLTPQAADQMLASRNKWLINAQSFNASLREYVAKKMSEPDKLKIDVGPGGIEDYVYSTLGDLRELRTVNAPVDKRPFVISKGVLDFSNDSVASQIVLNGLCIQARAMMSSATNSLHFGVYNIFSPAYDEGQTTLVQGNNKVFADVKSEIEKYFTEAVRIDASNKQLGLVDYEKFHHFLWESSQTRYRKFNISERMRIPTEDVYKEKQKQFSFVVCKNDKSIWKTLTSDWNALSTPPLPLK